jgi:Staphylococcal nuclease homologue
MENMQKKSQIILLVLFVVLLIVINYNFLDSKLSDFVGSPQTNNAVVTRVIDGDTLVLDSGEHIRLLGINAPETTTKEKYSEDAKKRLNELVENKTVTLEFGKERYDKYNRLLAYIFLGNENVNIELVRERLANYYFYSGKDIHSSELISAWNICINDGVNLCEKSTDACGKCIALEDTETLINNCNFDCNISGWMIKTEGRGNEIFANEILQSNEKITFNLSMDSTGDSLFLWDKYGKLVLWKSYY